MANEPSRKGVPLGRPNNSELAGAHPMLSVGAHLEQRIDRAIANQPRQERHKAEDFEYPAQRSGHNPSPAQGQQNNTQNHTHNPVPRGFIHDSFHF